MRILSILLLFILSFPLAGRAVAQDCTNPDGDVGVLRYNLDYGVLQGCTPKNWVALHSAICPDGDACIDPCDDSPALGTMCDDGSYYIGLSPENGAKTFMTSVAHEGSGIRFDSASCEYCGDGSVATSQTDGRANTNALFAFNATGFDAAAHCEGLNTTAAHGHTDWYLPAGGPNGSLSEINLIWLTVQSAGGVGGLTASDSGWYWSSSEGNGSLAMTQRFSDGSQGGGHKTGATLVRCVRRSSDPIWTTPEGTVATIDLGAALNATVTATDDSGTVTYSKDSGAGWISVNSTTGALTGTAPGSATTASITITATDPSGNTATRTFDVVVEEIDPCETGSVGTVCADGAVYAGDDRGWRMYVAPCDAGMNWDGSVCTGSAGTYAYGGYGTDLNGDNASVVPELRDDGLANTDWLLTSGTGDHDAAQACRNKGADWYLPAIDELGDLFANRAQLGPANLPTSTSWYWSSSESNGYGARIQRFSDGLQNVSHRNGTTFLVRCVRR